MELLCATHYCSNHLSVNEEDCFLRTCLVHFFFLSINMHSIWGKKSKEAQAEKKKPRTTAAQIRVQKDLAELDIPDTIQLDFPDASNILNFNVSILPMKDLQRSNSYPHEPPKVRCTQKIYHPNIDLEGNICLNILREDWKPVLSLQAVLVGLQYLFLEPNAEDPLNKAAAEVLTNHRKVFESNVKRSMTGGSFDGVRYDTVLE
ncbi:unnamed protein product [Rhizopus stolonifer]